jgi:DNA-binding IclR family transcriptional regulator
MSSNPDAKGYRERNSTADRALTILGMFTDAQPTISAGDVAAQLGVARSTAYRYVQSLVGENFLEEAPSGGFRLGMRILELARLARRSYGVVDVAVPVMRELADRYRQTVLLTRRVGAAIVCVERQESEEQYIRLSYERGSILPINAGASALVLLAWLPEQELRSLLEAQQFQRFTDLTITDFDELLVRLKKIRESGIAVSFGEVDPDMLGIAVPVFDARGRVTVGLSMVVVQSRVPESTRGELIDALRSGAEKIGAALRLAD